MELILHHYDFSNFSEKVRLMLGLKDLAWHSVEIPAFLPKPDYVPLTAGYRRTPALQIGADVYCDTRLIADVLEAWCPQPSLFAGPHPARTRALCDTLAPWSECQMFWPLALHITGLHAEQFSPEFHADRAHLHGKPLPSIERVKASARKNLAQFRPQIAWIEDLLGGGTNFVLGDDITLADFSLYLGPWFLETIGGRSDLLDQQPLTRAWMRRVRDVGHGRPTSLAASAALDAAAAATPAPITPAVCNAPEEVKIGDRVAVSPLDEVSPALGSLAHIDNQRISIHAQHPRVEDIAVHFPRVGYRVRRQRQDQQALL